MLVSPTNLAGRAVGILQKETRWLAAAHQLLYTQPRPCAALSLPTKGVSGLCQLCRLREKIDLEESWGRGVWALSILGFRKPLGFEECCQGLR